MSGYKNQWNPSQQPSTPPATNAPYMYPRGLPPSPQSPSTNMPRLRDHNPSTPHVRSVPLPSQAAPAPYATYGLMTPPSSPDKAGRSSGRTGVHPVLTPQSSATGVLYFHVGYGADYVRLQSQSPGVMQSAATNPSATHIQVVVNNIFAIDVTNPNGVTVGDVFRQLHEGFARRARAEEVAYTAQLRGVHPSTIHPGSRRIDLVAPTCVFAGLTPTGDGRWMLLLKA